MTATRCLALSALALLVAAAGCDGAAAPGPEDRIPAGPGMTYEAGLADGKADNPNAPSCGGIAGLVCPEGMKCLMHDSYPDAMGTCVGPQQHDKWASQCAAVKCAYVECPAGTKFKVTPNHCCGTCVGHPTELGEGQCNTVQDCEGLPHIMCVGAWSCDKGWCSYTCDSEPVAVCDAMALCVEGYTWNAETCQCEKDPAKGEICGSKTCPAGQVCCNSSCGICTDPGGFCTEQFCLDASAR